MDRKVSVVVNQPSIPDGEQLDIPGLGLFRNRVPRTVTDDDIITFRSVQPPELFQAVLTEGEKPEGEAAFQTERGLILSRAFAGSPHINVVEEEVEPIGASKDKDVDSKQESKRTVKSSAPVGSKGTDAKTSDKGE
jgi:hypothetical protein